VRALSNRIPTKRIDNLEHAIVAHAADDHWYSLNTAGSGFDTVLGLRTCAGPELACNDNAAGLITSEIVRKFNKNDAVQVVVGGNLWGQTREYSSCYSRANNVMVQKRWAVSWRIPAMLRGAARPYRSTLRTMGTRCWWCRVPGKPGYPTQRLVTAYRRIVLVECRSGIVTATGDEVNPRSCHSMRAGTLATLAQPDSR